MNACLKWKRVPDLRRKINSLAENKLRANPREEEQLPRELGYPRSFISEPSFT